VGASFWSRQVSVNGGDYGLGSWQWSLGRGALSMEPWRWSIVMGDLALETWQLSSGSSRGGRGCSIGRCTGLCMYGVCQSGACALEP